MNRTQWIFSYPANTLFDAAMEKRRHHAERLGWWEQKKAEVVTTIRAEGIEVDESLADLISNSYQRGGTVHVRADLVRDVQECVQKIREHRAKVEDYDGWAQVLSSQGSTTFGLHQEDWLFFFGSAAIVTASQATEAE